MESPGIVGVEGIMRTFSLLLATVLALALWAQVPRDDVDPKTIITKAIEAHGGREKLAQARSDWVKIKGTLYIGDKEAEFVGETWVQLPGQFKTSLEVTTPRGTTRMVQTLNKNRVQVTVDGQPHTASPAELSEIRATLHMNNAIRLIPLLDDPNTFKLDYTGELKIQDKNLLGVKVTTRGQRDLRLYFDKTNGMLVRTEQMLDDGSGKEVRQEAYYLNFRALGGYLRPVKMAAYRDGKKILEAELVEVKYHDKFPDELFVP
jgi:hypothetical protein